jgi:glycosyltransferase involved in cell wall biosynthesis
MTEDKPGVSVIIPTYNRAELVTRAIESVLTQTYKNYEIIVVDDGSTDNTGELLRRRYGNRIQYIYQDNAGVSSARNTGINASRFELVAFLDSDDVWLPKKLEVQIFAMSEPDIVLSSTNCLCGDYPDKDFFSAVGLSFGKGIVVIPDPVVVVSRTAGTGIVTSTTICRKSALRRIGGFDERMKIYEDVRVQFRLAMEGKFAVISEPLIIWSRADNIRRLSTPDYWFFRESADMGAEIFGEFYARTMNCSAKVRKRLRRNLAFYLTRQSEYLALEGKYGLSRRKAFESLVFIPMGKSALRAAVGLFMPRAFRLLSRQRKNVKQQK